MWNLNKRQTETLRMLIHKHMIVMLSDKEKAKGVFEIIQKYGVSSMPQAVELYRYNSKRLNKEAHSYHGLCKKS